jgi:hypothetical protein
VPEDRANLILEPAFSLIYYAGFTWSEVQLLPVAYKRWFIERLNKELKQTSESGETQSRALHQNSPEVRSMQGKAREQSPSRLRRFT